MATTNPQTFRYNTPILYLYTAHVWDPGQFGVYVVWGIRDRRQAEEIRLIRQIKMIWDPLGLGLWASVTEKVKA